MGVGSLGNPEGLQHLGRTLHRSWHMEADRGNPQELSSGSPEVGAANATAAGWGNLGGGVTNALTPVVFNIMMAATNKNIDLAWRLTFLLPLAMHLVTSVVVLSGRDLPDGQFGELERSGAKQKGDSSIVLKVGI